MRIITNPRTQHVHRLVGGSLAVLALGGVLAVRGDFTVDDLDDTPISEVPLDEGSEAPTRPEPNAPEPPLPSTPPTTEQPAAPSPSAELEDGRHFGYAVGYERDGAGDIMRFDLARFYSGDEADAAAAEDGVIVEGGQIENDVHVRNTNTRLRGLRLAGDAAVTVIDCDGGCEPVAADLAALQGRPVPTPVWVTVEDGVVVAAEEMYLP
jgi:hypothetical protein